MSLKYILSAVLVISTATVTVMGVSLNELNQTQKTIPVIEQKVLSDTDTSIEHPVKVQEVVKPQRTSLVISAVGDCTLGTDPNFAYWGSFPAQMDTVKNDYSYPFSGVIDVLSKDDLTIANLETPLTNANSKASKKFTFKGKPEYVQILKQGSVEAVNVANNHTYDFGEKGYQDTLAILKKNNVGAFGNGIQHEQRIREIKTTNLGFAGWSIEGKESIMKTIRNAKSKSDLVIVTFHWGEEGSKRPNAVQKTLGRAAIDAGADLVLGHHSHVLQGIESYKGRHIVYSLGNFSFGGNQNPNNKDSMIYQERFDLQDRKIVKIENKIIPVRISSVTHRNDYKPVLLQGQEAERVQEEIKSLSRGL